MLCVRPRLIWGCIRRRGSELAEIILLVEGQNRVMQFMRIIRAHIDDEHWAEEEVKRIGADVDSGP